jgi:hypothetical protein
MIIEKDKEENLTKFKQIKWSDFLLYPPIQPTLKLLYFLRG